ncbi:MAG: glycerophosphodiester phosphodiesterase family protein [Bacteroidales bacterium]|nr:glycerophosphodiester phosphodiesterase family protein [Bacteroidales bacterium]
MFRKMRNTLIILISAMIVFVSVSCSPKDHYATRTEKLLSELHDPESEYVLVISHRGDWRNYPENSIPAIESVIRMGVDMVELDVKMTKDSILVLMHDKTIDRMTNGKGKVSDITYDSLMTFRMRRAHNVVTDTVRVPTLREALLCCRDRILVNVDHAYDYYDEIVALTEELGVTGQVLMKGKSDIDKVNADMSSHVCNLLYMPVIDINRLDGQALFAEYQERGVVPMAYEVCWQNPGTELDSCVARIHKSGSKLWVNTFWPSVCGGFGNDDDAAYAASYPGEVYGQYIEMGASMIQTDRPAILIDYLRSIGRHD